MQETLERFQLTSEYRALEIMHQQDQVARLAPRAIANIYGSSTKIAQEIAG
jgi:4-hydroxy 2-oxovalerate aldolase